MKRTVIFSLLIFIVMTGMTGGFEPAPMPAPTPGLNFNFKIVFKRPKMNCERGFGICLITSVYWGESLGGREQSQCPASITLNERKQLTISVKEQDLTKYDGGSALPYFKGKSSVTIPDPYAIPEEICRNLGADPPLTIPSGTYPVTYEDGIYTLVIRL